VVPALAVVRERAGIVLNVGDQPGRRLDQPRQARIRAGQGGDGRVRKLVGIVEGAISWA